MVFVKIQRFMALESPNEKRFTKIGIGPEIYYKNKYAVVTGRIQKFNGPEIIIREPEQIEIVER